MKKSTYKPDVISEKGYSPSFTMRKKKSVMNVSMISGQSPSSGIFKNKLSQVSNNNPLKQFEMAKSQHLNDPSFAVQ